MNETTIKTQYLPIDVAGVAQLTVSDLIGRRVAALGVSGTGKTNTVAVLIESLLDNGIPLTIIDPEGEYWGLRQRYQIIIAGRGEHVDLPITVEGAGELARFSITDGFPVILDVSEFSQSEQDAFLLEYMTVLWDTAGKVRRPYFVAIEEAHEFLPQGGRTPLADLFSRVALRGRKRGLGAIISSQRSAQVSKSFLTQAEIYFLHRVIHPVDLKTYRDLIPLTAKEVDETVGKLQRGQAVYLRNNVAQVVTVKQRETYHAGATPQLEGEIAARLKPVDVSALVEKLGAKQETSSAKTPQPPALINDAELKAARQLAERREQETQKLVLEVKRLQAENDRLQKELEKERLKNLDLVKPAKPAQQVVAAPIASAVGGKLNDLLKTDAQRKRYARLGNKVKNLPPFQKKILAYLQERAELKPQSLDTIAIALGRKGADGKMMPVLVRGQFAATVKPISGPTLYKSNLAKLVAEEFPGVEPGAIVRELEKLLDS